MRMRGIVLGSLAVQFVIALGGALTAAVLTASNPPSVLVHEHPLRTETPVSWPLVLALAVAGGIAALVAVWGLIWLGQFVAYLRKRGRHDWTIYASVAGNGIKFLIGRHPEAMPEALSDHGVVECRVKMPNGNVLWPTVHQWGDEGRFALITPLMKGTYHVSWYGSYGSRRHKRKRYELTHVRFPSLGESEDN
jgi:hypothetical protein